MDKRQVGFSTACLPRLGVADALREGRQMGFGAVEVCAFQGARHSGGEVPGLWFDRADQTTLDSMHALASDFESLSTHAPFIHAPLFTHNPDVALLARRQVRAAIDGAVSLGGTLCTVHVNPRPFMHVREFWDEALRTLRALGDYATGRGVTVAVETGYPDTMADFCELLTDVHHGGVGACLDVGHLVQYVPRPLWGTAEGARALNDRIAEMLRLLGGKVVSLHLHDVRRRDFRDHRRCGQGIVDFGRLMEMLAGVDFRGPMFMELEEQEPRTALLASKAFVENVMARRHAARAPE